MASQGPCWSRLMLKRFIRDGMQKFLTSRSSPAKTQCITVQPSGAAAPSASMPEPVMLASNQHRRGRKVFRPDVLETW